MTEEFAVPVPPMPDFPVVFNEVRIMPVLHFGPTYPPEDAYYRGLISFESAVKCCRLGGYYSADTAPYVPWDAGTSVATSREGKVRNLAFFLWCDGGKPSGQRLQHWNLAEELTARFEDLVATTFKPMPVFDRSNDYSHYA